MFFILLNAQRTFLLPSPPFSPALSPVALPPLTDTYQWILLFLTRSPSYSLAPPPIPSPLPPFLPSSPHSFPPSTIHSPHSFLIPPSLPPFSHSFPPPPIPPPLPPFIPPIPSLFPHPFPHSPIPSLLPDSVAPLLSPTRASGSSSLSTTTFRLTVPRPFPAIVYPLPPIPPHPSPSGTVAPLLSPTRTMAPLLSPTPWHPPSTTTSPPSRAPLTTCSLSASLPGSPSPSPSGTPPLPDTGQWLLLALNNHLPAPLTALLPSRLPAFPPSPLPPFIPPPPSSGTPPLPDTGQWLLLALNNHLPAPLTCSAHYLCSFCCYLGSPSPSPCSGTPPLPDTGQWLLLALNNHLPAPLTALLRARLVEMHDFLMLFMLLAFSVLFNCIPPSGIGLGARYCFTIGLSRLLRFLTFASTILPAVRPWCAAARFGSTSPRHPHPWAQKYFVPYATNHDMLHQVISTDVAFAPQVHYLPEYQPNWGAFQFLVDFLRPMDARAHHGAAATTGAFSSFVIRPYGGCNDLAFSGHIIVAALTACAWQSQRYRHFADEFRNVPKFLACVGFMLLAFVVEVIAVQFVTVVLGLDWHKTVTPLPDTGQWILLGLNDRLPAPLTALLRAPIVEMHDFIMLFMLLAFSVLVGAIPGPGMALGSRYVFSIGLSRILRVATFVSTILPAPRPWCAESRFGDTCPRHPHPWAAKYLTPYNDNPDLLHQLISTDTAFAPQMSYPPEFRPDWGSLQFLVDFLRPMDARVHDGAAASSGAFSSFVVRPYGGCNDLAFSGHIVVAALTACAWQVGYSYPALKAER
ncbi:unnamed protein product [Closterium sp. Naga37s-1]|nr:unnamed protein product [Closterium sp. Naga37s-1]